MDDSNWIIAIGTFTLAIGLVVGIVIGISFTTAGMRKQAIECGAAQYNSITAEFEWKEKVGE